MPRGWVRSGAGLALRIIRLGQSLEVRDLVVEPERDRHRAEPSSAVDQQFQPPRLQGSKPELAGSANNPASCIPLCPRRTG